MNARFREHYRAAAAERTHRRYIVSTRFVMQNLAGTPTRWQISSKGPVIKESDTPEVTAPILTTVEAKIDVGFGNTLFIRGQGDGLSWDQGIPLRCLDSSTWVWSTSNARDKLVFKLLLNDETWSQGEDHIALAGMKTEVCPAF